MSAEIIGIRSTPVRKRDRLKRFCQCLGLSSILLVMNYGEMLGGGAEVRMHVPYPLVSICIAQLADIFLLALLIFAIVVSLERTRAYPVVRLLIAIIIPPYIIFRLQSLIPFAQRDGLLTILFIVWGAVVLTLYLRLKVWYRRLIRFGNGLAIFLFAFAISSIFQLLFVILWKPGPFQQHASWGPASQRVQPPREHPLMVWIVFDELSLDQTFGHRAHNLNLPNFDALRNESTLFTNTQPIGNKTVKIIPSLFTGRVLDDIHFGFNNKTKAHYVGIHGWHPFDGTPTLFSDAQQQGWRTAAVGWYNPYCTIYAGTIDECYSMNLDRIDGDMAQRNGFWRNVYSPLAGMVREVKAPDREDRDSCTYDVRHRLDSFINLQDHAMQLLKNDQADFVFLHLPVPHSPNIWSRNEDNYTTFCDSSYLDNLALADRTLGQVLAQLQSSPRWKDTTVIVQGDHSWRTYIWSNMPTWTEADDQVSRSGFDSRPALLIHQAGQTKPKTDAAKWSILNVHTVMEQVLHGQPVRF
jgi:hypothetical protein